MEVYRRSLDLLDRCDAIVAQLPPGRGRVRDQVERSSSSVVANIAEGAGEFSTKEKGRLYRMARRSAIEVAAWLDIIARRQQAPPEAIRDALSEIEQVVCMLVKLIKTHDR